MTQILGQFCINVSDIDESRRFYRDVLDAHGVPELAAQYCRMDDLVYEHMSPDVKWDRKHTLGRGNDCCAFRF